MVGGRVCVQRHRRGQWVGWWVEEGGPEREEKYKIDSTDVSIIKEFTNDPLNNLHNLSHPRLDLFPLLLPLPHLRVLIRYTTLLIHPIHLLPATRNSSQVPFEPLIKLLKPFPHLFHRLSKHIHHVLPPSSPSSSL